MPALPTLGPARALQWQHGAAAHRAWACGHAGSHGSFRPRPATGGRHAGGDAVGQQRGQVRLHLVQRRGRAAMRRPGDTGPAAPARRAAEPRQPHRHDAEQCRDLTRLPVLDVAARPAARARRPQRRMIAGLHSDDRLLDTGQQQLGLGQRQARLAMSRRSRDRSSSRTSMPRPRVSGLSAPVSTSCSTNPIHALPAGLGQAGHTVSVPTPQSLDGPLRATTPIVACPQTCDSPVLGTAKSELNGLALHP